jgi:hypothetical protein
MHPACIPQDGSLGPFLKMGGGEKPHQPAIGFSATSFLGSDLSGSLCAVNPWTPRLAFLPGMGSEGCGVFPGFPAPSSPVAVYRDWYGPPGTPTTPLDAM